jgi:hypothetical protein
MTQGDLRWQHAAHPLLRRLVFLLRLPPRQAESFGQGRQEITLTHAFTIQHRIHKGGLIEARFLYRLPNGRKIGTTRVFEDLINEWKHENEDA